MVPDESLDLERNQGFLSLFAIKRDTFNIVYNLDFFSKYGIKMLFKRARRCRKSAKFVGKDLFLGIV